MLVLFLEMFVQLRMFLELLCQCCIDVLAFATWYILYMYLCFFLPFSSRRGSTTPLGAPSAEKPPLSVSSYFVDLNSDCQSGTESSAYIQYYCSTETMGYRTALMITDS